MVNFIYKYGILDIAYGIWMIKFSSFSSLSYSSKISTKNIVDASDLTKSYEIQIKNWMSTFWYGEVFRFGKKFDWRFLDYKLEIIWALKNRLSLKREIGRISSEFWVLIL